MQGSAAAAGMATDGAGHLPYIHLGPMPWVGPLQHLWRHVVERAAQAHAPLLLRAHLRRQPKVRQLDAVLLVQEQVGQLEVAVEDAAAVQVLHSRQHLGATAAAARIVL